MTFKHGTYARALLLVTLAACRQPATQSGAAEESAEERAVKEFTKAGPGTVTSVVCEHGSARIVDRSSGSSVECRGPRGSTTTTSIVCESGNLKTVQRPDRLLVFCPEQAPTAAAPVETDQPTSQENQP